MKLRFCCFVKSESHDPGSCHGHDMGHATKKGIETLSLTLTFWLFQKVCDLLDPDLDLDLFLCHGLCLDLLFLFLCLFLCPPYLDLDLF